MLLHIVIIIILFIVTYSRNVINRLQKLFNLYNDKYYPIKEYLSEKELDYINFIMYNSPLDIWNFTMEGKRLSFISYSHEYDIKEKRLISGRMACGSIYNSDIAMSYALDIFSERSITPPDYLIKLCRFGGLGWDFNNNYFKIYFRFFDKNILNNLKFIKKYQKYVKRIGNKYWGEGLISLTYNKTKLIEEKVYLYPKYKDFKENHDTIMLSSKRGVIKHTDIHDKNKYNYEILNNLIDDYKKDGFTLDTISKYKDKITIYFPK